jgi:hypothetical protein
MQLSERFGLLSRVCKPQAAARNPKFSPFCPSVLPVKISSARGGVEGQTLIGHSMRQATRFLTGRRQAAQLSLE